MVDEFRLSVRTRPSLTIDQKSAGAASEDSTGQNMKKRTEHCS